MHGSKEVLLFGGMNEFGEVSKVGRVLVIENEEKDLHRFSDSAGFELEGDGDLFSNCGCIYRQGDTAFIIGSQALWSINDKEKRVLKDLDLQF